MSHSQFHSIEFTLILAWLSLGNKHMELAGSTRYRWVVQVHHSRGFRRIHYEGIRPVFSAERVPEARVNFSSLSSRSVSATRQACVEHTTGVCRAHDRRVSYSFLLPRELVARVSLLLRVSFAEGISRSFVVVVLRYASRRVSRYLLRKQWVSLTRESALKFPLTASIQAEFYVRAVISAYQQSSVTQTT